MYYRLDSIEIFRAKIQHLSFLRDKRKIGVIIRFRENLVVD